MDKVIILLQKASSELSFGIHTSVITANAMQVSLSISSHTTTTITTCVCTVRNDGIPKKGSGMKKTELVASTLSLPLTLLQSLGLSRPHTNPSHSKSPGLDLYSTSCRCCLFFFFFQLFLQYIVCLLYNFYMYIKNNPSQRGYFYFADEQSRAQRHSLNTLTTNTVNTK